MSRKLAPVQPLTEGIVTFQLVADYTPGRPGIVLQSLIPGRKGVVRSHWPTVSGKVTDDQVQDIQSTVTLLLRGVLVSERFMYLSSYDGFRALKPLEGEMAVDEQR